ncbi:hypothetical protein [Kocuria rhizosphaericola]|uniref:hypothetical protein n=1 Tax=Kocuria rhizosphaericola TaxID=3376284 RepID=UPI003790BA23
MTHFEDDKSKPYWLVKMRRAAKQRPRTQFVKVRWIELQYLLRERDALWEGASPDTRERLLALRKKDDYGYLSPQERMTWQARQADEEPA